MSFINNNVYFKDSISNTFKNLGYKEFDNNETNDKIFFCDVGYNDRKNPTFEKCMIVNQLENINPLGNKKQQYDYHLQYYKSRPEYIPMTMAFTKDKIEDICNLFVSNPRESPKIYIVKPENDSFRNGCGLVRNKLELQLHLKTYDMYNDWIIQDYIDNPLLINKRKFHFRVYVIYLQNKDFQAAYLSKVGFIYTANKDFEKGNLDLDICLSGESSPNNVYYIPEDFQNNFGKSTWEGTVVPQIVKICRETLKSVLDLLKCPTENQKCFKILGYDILINDEHKCYLAEINARGVTYKYPNEQFLNSFYNNILKLILPETPLTNKELQQENIPFERILFKKDGQISECFGNINNLVKKDIVMNQLDKFDKFYWKIIIPFMIIVIIIIAIQLEFRN